ATMPQQSGVEEPGGYKPSENLFRLAKDEWIPHPIDDPDLPKQLMAGFKRAKLCLRDQIVVRMAFESGARIGELLRLTVRDWRERGGYQEARACSTHELRNEVVTSSEQAATYASVMRKNEMIPHKGGRYGQYRRCVGEYPNLFALGPF